MYLEESNVDPCVLRNGWYFQLIVVATRFQTRERMTICIILSRNNKMHTIVGHLSFLSLKVID